MISAGRLRHVARGLRASARSALNEPITWAEVTGDLRCDYRADAQNQGREAGGAVTVTAAEVRFRWPTWAASGLTAADRLRITANGSEVLARIEGVVNLDQANRVAVVAVSEVLQ